MIRLVVLADDFTGALDTGIQFGKLGINTVVTQQIDGCMCTAGDCEVLVINTESRHLTKEKAGQKLCEISETIKKAGVSTVYKGNIIKNLIMDCQSYTKYRPNETTGGIFVSWRGKEELPTGLD
ncbi:four-carbon acid sugar kinase family protein [Eubacterium callanderi]|uniref:Four-carbon acid sugar kinase N-terminal domain-containing protein n=1 Tax=Eubacterium callanderi TaxID=53442 RepID=A0A853JJF0_9FIRM|nr:hypothetical protein [Eubacterium callanderi]